MVALTSNCCYFVLRNQCMTIDMRSLAETAEEIEAFQLVTRRNF